MRVCRSQVQRLTFGFWKMVIQRRSFFLASDDKQSLRRRPFSFSFSFPTHWQSHRQRKQLKGDAEWINRRFSTECDFKSGGGIDPQGVAAFRNGDPTVRPGCDASFTVHGCCCCCCWWWNWWWWNRWWWNR